MTMTTSEASISQPESLDLDFDDWEGQFEFVGGTTGQSSAEQQNTSGRRTVLNSDDELNFSSYVPSHQAILIDEETFLSLQPNDFEDSSGPQSELFIEDYGDSLRNKCNKETINNKFVSAKYSAEELNNFKNKLFVDEFNMKGLKSHNNNNNNNEFAADLCDNLSEQVCISGGG